MPDDFRRHLQDQFEQKDTVELLAIWQENDRVEWSSQTFEVVEEILKTRLGELPPQNEPILEHIAVPDDQKEAAIDPSSPLYPYLAAENAPVLYDPSAVLRLERWLNRLAWVFAGFWIMYGFFANIPMWENEVLLLAFGASILNALVTFLMLKALAFILKMLMQMEFSSRGIGIKR